MQQCNKGTFVMGEQEQCVGGEGTGLAHSLAHPGGLLSVHLAAGEATRLGSVELEQKGCGAMKEHAKKGCGAMKEHARSPRKELREEGRGSRDREIDGKSLRGLGTKEGVHVCCRL